MDELFQRITHRPALSSNSYASLSYRDYTVGLICALPIERAAAEGMLDEIHKFPPQRVSHDDNHYTFGRIGPHNVVVACLPTGMTGTTSAARVANQMLSSFGSMKLRLLVGVGGGVPGRGADIRLGDVVVSKPTATYGGVIQYDMGRTVGESRFELTGMLNRPPDVLLSAVSGLQAKQIREGRRLSEHLTVMMDRYRSLIPGYSCPGTEHDSFYDPGYEHIAGHTECDACDAAYLVRREPRSSGEPDIHYGLIATGNQVMKHGPTRDRLGNALGVLCFEMEAAGLMDNFPCLVIRGICDYADSHKNKRWQGYAAATAAAYAKELLLSIMPGHNGSTHGVFETNEGSVSPTSIKQHSPLLTTFKAKLNRPRTRFIAAAEAGDVSILRKLLDEARSRKSQPNAETFNKALMAVLSVEKLKDEHAETVRLLLSQGATLDCKDDKHRRTPLIWAIIHGREDLTELFLDNNAAIHERDGRWDGTPLMWAIWCGRDEMIERLIHHGANPEATDKAEGRTPLLWAVKFGRHVAAERLLQKKWEVIEIKDKKELTPLALAYMEGDGRAAELLLRYGADPNFKFDSGLPLLMSAIMAGDEPFVHLLVEGNPDTDVQCRNKKGEPALSVAVKEGRPAIAKILLDNGALREAKDNQGRTALLWAVARARSDLVELLVRSGANKSATDNEHRTVGQWADWTRDERIIELVSEADAMIHLEVKSSLPFD